MPSMEEIQRDVGPDFVVSHRFSLQCNSDVLVVAADGYASMWSLSPGWEVVPLSAFKGQALDAAVAAFKKPAAPVTPQ